MSVLSSKEIIERSNVYNPLIFKFNEDNVSPASYDMTLAHDYILDGNDTADIMDESITVKPGEFLLMSTNETVSIPADLIGIVKGKSSLARLGLMVECAGFVDPGFTGQITLEVKNLSNQPIKLTAGMKICQIVFMEMKTEPEKLYSTENGHHYSGQVGVTKSWMRDRSKAVEKSNIVIVD